MNIKYDAETDSLVIKFRDAPVEESDEFSKNLIADFGVDGEIVSIEVLRASRVVDDTQSIIFEKTA